MVLRHRSLYGTFSIRRVPMGPAVTHSWRLQFIIKFSARYFLHTTCTCGTLLHPTYTCGTCSYSSMMLVIHHKSLRSVLLHPTYGTRGLRVTCTYEIFLHLYPTYGTRRFACHLYHVCHRGLISQKMVWYLGVEHMIWTKNWSIFTIALDAWLCWHLFGVAIVSYWLCYRLT